MDKIKIAGTYSVSQPDLAKHQPTVVETVGHLGAHMLSKGESHRLPGMCMVSCLLAWCDGWRPHNQPPGWLTDAGLKDSIASL